MNDAIQLVECPRDAMQGWKKMISTHDKVKYINSLLKVGFDTIDFGSFVSAKAIPQMADTAEVVQKLDSGNSHSKLLAIIANLRGARETMEFEQIACLGYPFSVSPTFQMRNTNNTMESSFSLVRDIQSLCLKNNKQLIVYISMAFGNPYGDSHHEDIVEQWADQLSTLGVNVLSIADTVGLASPVQVSSLFTKLKRNHPAVTIGVHLHSTAVGWKQKIDAALSAGCRRFDGALKGIGGCPMANDELVGNINTEFMIPYFEEKKLLPGLDHEALADSLFIANQIFQ
ncbi:MAG: hydroxymethylglutaryl-CoA lyase [Ginsengibacter sp.]